ncbi:hypothetical protein KC887_01210 [Candidatus Kaiserbacteria bacterium]|nr:hypothetical protein [Candidatus Kaiserbacteria bacterium]
MTVTTTLEALKTLVSNTTPSSGGAVNVYAVPADVSQSAANGGISYALPVGLVMQRLGNDAAQNSTGIWGSGCFVHRYHVEIMIGLGLATTINEQINRGKLPTSVIMAPYESKAQLWLAALHAAVIANYTLSGTVTIGLGGSVIEDYRIGYLPWENPGMFGLWCSLAIEEPI